MLLGTLDASLLGNVLARKEINRAGKGVIRAGAGIGKGINRAGEGVLVMRQGRGILRASYGSRSSSALHNDKMDS